MNPEPPITQSLARAAEVDSAALASNMTRDNVLPPHEHGQQSENDCWRSRAGGALCAAGPGCARILRMCNNTGNRVSVAIGYTDGQNWVSEGWWNSQPLDCVTSYARGPGGMSIIISTRWTSAAASVKLGKVFACTSDLRVQDRRPAGLLCARLQPNRIFRSRHRQRFKELDRATDRPGEPLSRNVGSLFRRGEKRA